MATEGVTTGVVAGERAARRQLLADGALVGVTVVWGTSFVMVKDIIGQVSPVLFLPVRFAIAALGLAILTAALGRWRGLTWREVRWGALIGVALWAAYLMQTLGLQYTTASNGGFITGLSVVMVPLFGLLVLRQGPHRWAVAGIVLATLGLALLTLRVEEGLRANEGDALIFGCAVGFALQIVLVAHVAGWCDPLRLSLVQVLVAGILNALSALFLAQPVAGLSLPVWAGAAFLGLLGTAGAIAIQTSAQRFTTAVHTALIFTLEPVFAALFGVWLQGDRFGPASWLGATLILGGMLLAELGPQLRLRGAKRAAL